MTTNQVRLNRRHRNEHKGRAIMAALTRSHDWAGGSVTRCTCPYATDHTLGMHDGQVPS